MIKYIEYDNFDEYGQHIIPINSLYQMNKTASGSYSPELMKVILNMKRRPERYYVVINALGSGEIWGPNRNGDFFPEEGLKHKSLRTDMGTINEYGYKTFEYLAHLFKHHVNKNPNKSFGEIIFSHWNPVIHRVELIVAINTNNGKDIIEAIDKGEQVSVSMGCFTNPEYPILTIDGYKPIKDIKVNDLVFTHNGNWKKVTELHRRKYTGKIYKIELQGLPVPLELTADHPMMMKCFQKTSLNKERSYISPQQFESKSFGWTHIEHSEVGDHIQYLPVKYSEYGLSSISDEKLAKLMGYYFAEGSFVYNNGKPCTIQLLCHIDDDLPREVPKLINDLFPEITCSIKPHHSSNKGLSVEIHSTRLACFMNKYMSHLAHDKKIPPEIFISDKNIKLSFVGAWISGDGFCDNKGVHISSCNLNALLQARDLLISCNIAASLYKIIHKEGVGFNFHETTEYTLNISHIDAEPLIPYCNKKLSNLSQYISEREKKGNTAIRFNADGTFSYSIKSVEFTEVDNIQTYNFEVEDDESYIAAGLVSHNCKVKYDRCSICDNKASIRTQYCKHLKNYMGQIVDTNLASQWSAETGKKILPGTQVFAYNDFPKFFDISKVYVGADRTSYILGKAASNNHIQYSIDIADALGVTDDMIDKLAMVRKKGEIDKEISGALGPTDIDKPSNDSDGIITKSNEMAVIKKSLDEKINNTIIAEPQLPKDLLNSMSIALPLENIFSTMFGLGIHPKPVEFQRIVLVRLGEKKLADDLEENGTIFDTKDNSDPISINVSNSNFSETLGKTLMPFLSDRSCFPNMLGPRIQAVIIKTAGQLPWNESEKKEMKVDPKLATVLGGLAALYTGLKLKAMGYGPADLISIFNKPWLSTLIGGSVLWKLYNEIDKQKNKLDYLPPAREYANGLKNTNFSGHIIKEAAGKDIGSSLGAGLIGGGLILPSAYIANSWNQKSMYERGTKAFPGAGINPIAASAIGTAGITAAHHYGTNLKKMLLKKI